MIQKAYVEKINGDKAVISVKRVCACAGASECKKACFSVQESVVTAEADNDMNVSIGDIVEVETTTGKILAYAFLIFVVPIVAGFISFFSVNQVFSVPAAYMVSFVVFAVAFILLCITANKSAKKVNIKIVKIINSREQNL